MASKPIKIGYLTLAFGLGLVMMIELILRWALPRTFLPPLLLLGLARLLQTAGMLWAVIRWEGGLDAIGWSPRTWLRGLMQGAFWSLAFAAATAAVMGMFHLAGHNPLPLIRSALPSRTADIILYFLVGGWIAPLAEEICFRGIMYTFFRRWGVFAALAASTAIFVLLHANRGLPLTQIVGGLAFALAYETHRNLMAPITLHILGNLAIFAISLPWLQLPGGH